jgi:sugar-specific transcriptional regulator TrmB
MKNYKKLEGKLVDHIRLYEDEVIIFLKKGTVVADLPTQIRITVSEETSKHEMVFVITDATEAGVPFTNEKDNQTTS